MNARDEIAGMPAPASTLGTRGAMLVVLYGASLLLIGLGSVWVLTQHEVFAAQPAREMLRDGHWILPTFGGTYRLNKPPTTGWIFAGVMAFTGSASEWVVRSPSVVAAIVTAVLMSMLGARWFGRRAGIIAGLCQLTFYYVQKQARLAEADMMLCASVVCAMTAFGWAMSVQGTREPSKNQLRWWLPIAFYAATGMSFLLKLVGPIYVLPACVLYTILSGNRRGWRFLLNPVGIAIFVIMVVAWPYLAWRQYPAILHIGWRETFGRAQGEFGEGEPWHFYFWNVPMALLPWVGFTVWGLIVMVRRRAAYPALLFFACWFVPGFIILSISTAKHLHYAIMILPALTIPTAFGIEMYLAAAYANVRPQRLLASGLWVIGCAIGAGIVIYTKPAGMWGIVALVGVIAVGGCVVMYFEHRKNRPGQLAALFGTAWLALVGAHLVVMPHHDGYRAGAQWARGLEEFVPKNEAIYLINSLGEAQITYYVPRRVIRDDLKTLLERPAASREGVYLIGLLSLAKREREDTSIEIIEAAGTLARKDARDDPIVLMRVRNTKKYFAMGGY